MKQRKRGVARATGVAVVAGVVAVAALALVYGGGLLAGERAASPLVSFSADAYAPETTALLDSFSKSTGLPVTPTTSGGSFADANEISAGAPADVFVSVSVAATGPAYLGSRSSGWAIGFATDQMVVAYSNVSTPAAIASLGQRAEATNSTSAWNDFFGNLTSGKVKVGISDPVEDPAGLRGWLVLEAAGSLYAGGDQQAYVVPLVMSGGNVTGPHAADLVPALQSGKVQFLFIYRSAAVADGLPYISLDSHVNLGDPGLAGYYSRFHYSDSAGVQIASPIVLCVTVPLGGGDPASALRFVGYVVANAGTLSVYGLQPLSPARLYNDTTPPAAVLQLLSDGSVIPAGGL